MIDVFNVNQGDSALLLNVEPNRDLLIDCGDKKEQIHTKVTSKDFDIVISHSDNDHIGGLPDILNNSSNYKNIYIPYYLPEILSIYQFLNKKGVNVLQSILKKRVYLVKEGDSLYNKSLQIFNPPVNPNLYFMNTNIDMSLEEAIHILNEQGYDINSDDVLHYTSPILEPRFLNDNLESQNEHNENTKQFVSNYFISLAFYLREFNQFMSVARITTKHFKLTANQASIVFKYTNTKHHLFTSLFTGDADKNVFYRIENKYNLHADILKVPHHGGAKHLDSYILNKINPKYAILSHGNHKGYKHPSQSILNLLNSHSVQVLHTNDVLTGGRTLRVKSSGQYASKYISMI